MPLPLSILVYRRIIGPPDPLFPEAVDGRRFEQHLGLLQRWFRLMPLASAVRRLQDGTLPGRAACITIDGGYADSARVALPILQRHAAPATFFVASGFLDGGYHWSDAVIEVVREAPGERLDLAAAGFASYDIGCPLRRRAVIDALLAALDALAPLERLERVRAMVRQPTPTMLSADQVLALHRAGMEVGAHPVNHAPLATLSNFDARAEIAQGRARLEQIIQADVRLFAYPCGRPGCDYEQRHANMLRSAGFDAAVTTARGAAGPHADPYQLPRFTPWDRSKLGFLLRMSSNLLLSG